MGHNYVSDLHRLLPGLQLEKQYQAEERPRISTQSGRQSNSIYDTETKCNIHYSNNFTAPAGLDLNVL